MHDIHTCTCYFPDLQRPDMSDLPPISATEAFYEQANTQSAMEEEDASCYFLRC